MGSEMCIRDREIADAEEERDAVCGDGICERDKGETYENCPQDCVPEGEVKPDENKSASQPEATDQTPAPPASTSPESEPDWILIGGAIAGCLMLGILTYLLVRWKSGAPSG